MTSLPRRGSWLLASVCAVASMTAALGAVAVVRPAVAAVRPASPSTGAASAVASGPYATLLFSRTEMTAGDGCQPDATGIAPLGTVVAPYLKSRGMAATGSLVTGKTHQSAYLCTHYGDSLSASWDNAAALSQQYGWSFVSATATYPNPAAWATMAPAQQDAETCGSAAMLDAHGLNGGHGLIAYPGAQPPPVTVQAQYGAQCFAWGRHYGRNGRTFASAGTTAPFWQYTAALKGGACNDSSAPCYTMNVHGHLHYHTPSQYIAVIDSLKPGQWLTLQAYVLVTGTNPPYAHNGTRWDCTSANPDLHWTNDVERYCYTDWQQIVAAIAARPGIVVTDPLTVGVAFGRPATYP